MNKQLDKKSKYLSYLLRHKPAEANLTIEKNGWILVSDIIKNTDITLTELKTIVENDDKKRYSFQGHYSKIRANQGHSIPIEIEFETKEPPEFLYHGTSNRFLNSILKDGLTKQNRQFVHLSSDIETATKVGLRHGGELIIFKINAKQMFNDGYVFYISENGVWLIDNVLTKYFIFDN